MEKIVQEIMESGEANDFCKKIMEEFVLSTI